MDAPERGDRPELPIAMQIDLVGSIKGMDLDWGTHCQRGRENVPQPIFHILSGYCLGEEEARLVIEAHRRGEPLDRWVLLNVQERWVCPFCEERSFETNGLVIRLRKPCPNPDGIVTEWSLDFPSGKMLVANDLRKLCPLRESQDLCSFLGTHLQILEYAKRGIGIGFGIGNSSPSVYREADGRYLIGLRQKRVWAIEKADHPEPPPNLVPSDPDALDSKCWWVDVRPEGGSKYGDDIIEDLPEGTSKVASICTDLWAYSVIDFEDAKRRAASLGIDFDQMLRSSRYYVVECIPGKYRFQHYHGSSWTKDHVTFARFELIGDADSTPLD